MNMLEQFAFRVVGQIEQPDMVPMDCNDFICTTVPFDCTHYTGFQCSLGFTCVYDFDCDTDLEFRCVHAKFSCMDEFDCYRLYRNC